MIPSHHLHAVHILNTLHDMQNTQITQMTCNMLAMQHCLETGWTAFSLTTHAVFLAFVNFSHRALSPVLLPINIITKLIKNNILSTGTLVYQRLLVWSQDKNNVIMPPNANPRCEHMMQMRDLICSCSR